MTRRVTPLVVCMLSLQAASAAAQARQAAPDAVLLQHTHCVAPVDPVVGQYVDLALRQAVEAAGYRPVATDHVPSAQPPSMADLWRATHRANAAYAVLAVVWALQGRYVVQLRVAAADGSGPFYAQTEVGAEDLEAKVQAAVPRALPALPLAEKPPDAPQAATATATATATVTVRGQETPRSHRSLRLALHNDAALGLADPGFYNHLLGGRADFRFTPTLSLGAYGAYANLEGREGRVESVLAYLLLDQRIPLTQAQRAAVALRFALGYLARNGAFMRIGSALALRVSDGVELVFDLPAPAFWVTQNRILLSLNLGLELALLL